MLGHAQILLKKINEKEEIYPVVKKIERAAIRCRDIVADLLDFSRQESVMPTHPYVPAMITQMAPLPAKEDFQTVLRLQELK